MTVKNQEHFLYSLRLSSISLTTVALRTTKTTLFLVSGCQALNQHTIMPLLPIRKIINKYLKYFSNKPYSNQNRGSSCNPFTDSLALRKIVQRLEFFPSVTSSTHTNSMTFSWVIWTLLSPLSYYNGFRRFQDA